jgi:hypothetical protein
MGDKYKAQKEAAGGTWEITQLSYAPYEKVKSFWLLFDILVLAGNHLNDPQKYYLIFKKYI